MSALAKGAIGGLALLSISSAVAVRASRTATWNKSHPVATSWLKENNYSPKGDDKFADFVNNPSDTHFGLGCHRVLFGGKNFRKIYENSTVTNSSSSSSTQHQDSLPDTSFFRDSKDKEPLLGCSTSFNNANNIYDFELALRQGDKGFIERVSVHQDKIISQLVFYEKNTDSYNHIFGLYRYIKQNHKNGDKNIYQWANPIPTDDQGVWRNLGLTEKNKADIPKYYAVWVNGKGGKDIFDNLGVKSNEKIFSSVVKSEHAASSEDSVSDFAFINKEYSSSDQKSLQQGPLNHYSLSVLDSLIKDISKRKGHWKSVSSLCSSAKSLTEERIAIGELKQLSQYCYTQPKPKKQQ